MSLEAKMATRRTVLEFVQDILSLVEGDIVNDIGDTEESEMVTQILENTFYDIVEEFQLPYRHDNIMLDPHGTTDRPTHMTFPFGVSRIEEIRYDTLNEVGDPLNYKCVTYLDPKSFMQMINSRSEDEDNVDKITDLSGVKFLIVNDKNPDYWTSFDDENIVFDSYDSNIETWLQNSKTWATGFVTPTWVNDNNAKPDLPAHLESYFFNEACSMAYIVHKQAANPKIEQKVQRQRRALLDRDRVMGNKINRPNYGRK